MDIGYPDPPRATSNYCLTSGFSEILCVVALSSTVIHVQQLPPSVSIGGQRPAPDLDVRLPGLRLDLC